MRVPHGAELYGEQCQEQQAEKETEQEVEQQLEIKGEYQSKKEVRFNRESYGPEDKLDGQFWNKERGKLFPAISGKPGPLVPPLFIPEQFHPFESEPAIKPISNMLVTQDESGNYRFLALTASGADYYYKEMADLNKKQGNLGFKCAIVGANGSILCSSWNMTREDKGALLNSNELKEMTTFAAFLHGKINDPTALSLLVKKYRWSKSDFETLVNQVVRLQASCYNIELNTSSYFEEMCGWIKPKEATLDFSQICRKPPVASSLRPFILRTAKVKKKDSFLSWLW